MVISDLPDTLKYEGRIIRHRGQGKGDLRKRSNLSWNALDHPSLLRTYCVLCPYVTDCCDQVADYGKSRARFPLFKYCQKPDAFFPPCPSESWSRPLFLVFPELVCICF